MKQGIRDTPLPQLKKFREDACATFALKSWPTRKNERFKYTDLAACLGTTAWKDFSCNSIDQQVIQTWLAGFLQQLPFTCDHIVFCNGALQKALSTEALFLPTSEFRLAGLAETLADQPEMVLDLLTKEGSYFENWQRAKVSDGVYLKQQGLKSVRPLLILELISECEAKSQLLHHLHLSAGAELQVLQVQINLSKAPVFFNSLWDVHLGDFAQLTKYQVFLESDTSYSLNQELAKNEQNTQYEAWYINLSQALVRHDLKLNLLGYAAAAKLRAVLLGSKAAHLDHHWQVSHLADNTQTDILVHGVADDKSHLVFDGLIHVAEGVRGVIAHETNHNLLRTNTAEIDTKPELEIYSHDVRCIHGATVGNLDADALFYLQSRGFSAEEAVQVLLQSFSTQFLGEIQHPMIKAWIEQLILDKINKSNSFLG